MKRFAHLAALVAAIALTPTSASAAQFEFVGPNGTWVDVQSPDPTLPCTHRLTGPITKGDAGKIAATVPTEIIWTDDGKIQKNLICLDSPGGSFAEAVKIARLVKERLIGTRIEAGIRTLTLESEYALQVSKKISANLASVNLGYKPESNGFVKNIWVGYDFISGDDTSTVEMEGFSKYFGAGHKYHGFYDYTRHKKFMNHAHEGLREFNLKWNLDFLFETNLLVALHYFNSGDGNVHYGQEMDLIFKKIIFDGISLEQGFALYRPDNDDSILNFVYLMLTASL